MVKQVSVFVENKPGRLSGVAEALYDAGINICALSVADTTDFGLIRLIVNDPDTAVAVLKERGFPVKTTLVCACPLEHKPGGLFALTKVLDELGASFEYLYAFTSAGAKYGAVVVFCLTDKELHEKLAGLGLVFLTDADIASDSF